MSEPQVIHHTGETYRDQCLHHSGFESDIRQLRSQGEATCRKLDSIKMYLITMLGGLAVSLFLQVAKLMGG